MGQWYGSCPCILKISHQGPLVDNGFGIPVSMYCVNVGHSFLWCPSVLHVVHHTTSRLSLPLFYLSWKVRFFISSFNSSIARSVLWYWFSSICKDSYRASTWDCNFYCLSGYFRCGNKEFTKKCLCYISVMEYLNFPFRRLNHWSISQTNSLGFCRISIISFMYWSSELSFWNSFIGNFLISSSVLVILGELFASKIMYQSSVQSLSVMASSASLVSSQSSFFLPRTFHKWTNVSQGLLLLLLKIQVT